MTVVALSGEVRRRAARVKLLLLDVDGVLTDGRLHYTAGPGAELIETKAFDSQDGIALQWAAAAGIATGVISGRDSPAAALRARQCRMNYVRQGHLEKLPVYETILAEASVADKEVAYMGDDLTDAPILARVGLAAAPANARPEIRRIVHLATRAAGGAGAVRELIEVILRAQGKWRNVLQNYGL